MRLFKPERLNGRGDTIVEIMVVLAVLSLAFSISFATANAGLSRSRNAEEHTEAQGILSGQAERLRAAVSNGVTLPSSTNVPFCMKSDGTVATNSSWTSVPANVNADNLSTTAAAPAGPYPVDCNPGSSFYFASIVYVPANASSQAYYDLRVRWQGIGQFGKQQVEYTYSIQVGLDSPPVIPSNNPVIAQGRTYSLAIKTPDAYKTATMDLIAS